METEQKTGLQKAEAVRDYEAHTTGSDQIQMHWTRSLRFTEGADFLADTCGAFWLIDLVASHQPEIKRKHPQEVEFQVWRIYRSPRHPITGAPFWMVSAWSDSPGKSRRLAEQEIGYSDFPAGLSGFEFWVENGTMMLKSER